MTISFKSKEDFSVRTAPALINLVLGEDVAIKINLKNILKDRKITAKRLSEVTGIDRGKLSNYMNADNMSVINLEHLLAICIALRITDLSELIELDISKSTESRWKKDLKLWHENGWQPVYKNKEQ